MECNASVQNNCAPANLGVTPRDGGIDAAVFSRHGDIIWLCQFDDEGDREIARWRLTGRDGDIHYGYIPDIGAGGRYGLRADGPWQPEQGHRFDPHKLLVDPYATRLDRPFVWHHELAAPRTHARDTVQVVPRAIIEQPLELAKPLATNRSPGLIYELGVKAFTHNHPDIEKKLRGTLPALQSDHVLDHLVKLGVTHVELMPVNAWIDERHLAALGLSNAWGYNPLSFMALDPRLAPAGLSDLAATVSRFHAAGIAVLLDVVFNHTGESDLGGPTLSLRGLDNAVYYRHAGDDALINDTGCGNTLAAERPEVVRLIIDSLRTLVQQAGVDGFRFDLAATLARGPDGFDQNAPLLQALADDDVVSKCLLIGEPWDIGPGGYQLGQFPEPWLEWNDKYRDDVRRFWRGDQGTMGDFATRISGSADVFAASRSSPAASVNFLAAHDGLTLRDCVTYQSKHNWSNGEENRDGHSVDHSWNCGHEGETDETSIVINRARDVRAMIATLFLSRGTPMLTAGDEIGRTQSGNNNAYAQDNPTTWIDWESADKDLFRFVSACVRFRSNRLTPAYSKFLEGAKEHVSEGSQTFPDVCWLQANGNPMQDSQWHDASNICVVLAHKIAGTVERIFIAVNRSSSNVALTMPPAREGYFWRLAIDSASAFADADNTGTQAFGKFDPHVTARSVLVCCEVRDTNE